MRRAKVLIPRPQHGPSGNNLERGRAEQENAAGGATDHLLSFLSMQRTVAPNVAGLTGRQKEDDKRSDRRGEETRSLERVESLQGR
jgi:hypothetical protein